MIYKGLFLFWKNFQNNDMCKWMTKRYQNKCKRFYLKTCFALQDVHLSCSLSFTTHLEYTKILFNILIHAIRGMTHLHHIYISSDFVIKCLFMLTQVLIIWNWWKVSVKPWIMKSIGQTMNHEKCYKQSFILTFPIFPLNGINIQSNAFERVIT